MFGNLTDKFFCLLLGIFSVFILVLKNTEGQVTERFLNVKRTPMIEKTMKTTCNGQVVEVALPADYASALKRQEQNAALAAKGEQELMKLAAKNVLNQQAASEGVERYNENNIQGPCSPSEQVVLGAEECAKRAAAAGGAAGRRRRENFRENAGHIDCAKKTQYMAYPETLPAGVTIADVNAACSKENFEQPGEPNHGFHTVPGQLQSNLAPREFLGATQASKSVTHNFPENKHLTGRTPINEGYSPNFNNVIEPVENYRENQEEVDDGAPAESLEDPCGNIIGDTDGDGVMDASWSDTLGGPNSAVIMDRMVYKIAQSRRAGQGDMIRGDLPIQPCDQISRTSADPSADLQAGALGMITERAAGETTTNDLQAAYTGQSSTVATAGTA